MLKEIYCKKFKEKGITRPAIIFHKGLNTIVGTAANTEKSENSVGKSTLLMIIDFVFGGEAFLKSKAVKKEGIHEIYFCFEFNNVPYYFIRVSDKENHIFKCSNNYDNPQPLNISKFKRWLKEQYELSDIDLSFREIVGIYSRFYSDNDISPRNILQNYNGETPQPQIRRLEKLFQKDLFIKEYIDAIEKNENLGKVKKYASRLKIDLSEFKHIDEKETEKKIKALENEKKELLEKQKNQAIELDAQKAEELARLKSLRKKLASQRTILLTRIQNIENAHFETIKPSKSSYDALLEFFPNADIKRIEEIDSFHENLSRILTEEHQESLADYENEKNEIQLQIENLDNEISKYDNENNYSIDFLEKYAGIVKQHTLLSESLIEWNNRQEDIAKAKEVKDKLKVEEQKILNEIEVLINTKLADFSDFILGNDVESIRFQFPTNASYELGSPFDDGTGTDYTSLLLFDLSVLFLTKLPIVIHDSYLLSNIRGSRLEKLIKTYTNIRDKQVFLSIDETEKLDPETEAMVNDKDICVIELYKGGGELYGYYWGKKSNST